MSDPAGTVTLLLKAWRAGDRGAFDELIPKVYEELHRLAGTFLRGERPGHTFSPTDLVSEAYLRLGSAQPEQWNDRVHFFALAARAMRQVLVDHARRRTAGKRGSGQRPVSLDDQVVGPDRPEDLLQLDEALTALAGEDERKARVVELHYFAGLTQAEIAQALEIHANTVARDLRFAQAWLKRHMAEAG
ncbi:MAG TPA: sigma-70 family RNA polymerase sigma factor [Kofleriaceae bacterium]|nr:sigma-70 family RNA polymerase sigma factor [Kofleriaceae bacterium]